MCLFDITIVYNKIQLQVINLFNYECKWNYITNYLINKWENLKLALRGAYLLIL